MFLFSLPPGSLPGVRALAVLAVLALPIAAQAKFDVSEIREISALEDRRSLGDGRLAELLADEDPETRAAAARAFGRIGYEEGVGALLGAIEDSDPSVRLEVVFALGQIGSSEARDALNRVAGSNASVKERSRAVIALGKISGEGSAESVLPYLADAEASIRSDAALALAATGDSVAAIDLRPLLTDEDPVVRTSAVWAAGRLKAKELAPEVRACLEDPDPEVKLAATKSAGQLQDAEAVEALSLLARDPDWRVRANVATSLGQTRDLKAIAGLTIMMNDENPLVRTAVAAALEFVPEHYKRDDILFPLRNDDVAMVRAATMEPLAIGLENMQGALQEHFTALADTSQHVVQAALASMAAASERMGPGTPPNQWKTSAMVFAKVRLGQPERPLPERAASAYHVGSFSSTMPLKEMLAALDAGPWILKAGVLRSFGQLVPFDSAHAVVYEEETPEVIRRTLEEDPDAQKHVDIRLFGAEALGRFDCELSRRLLLEMAANDPDHRVRAQAAASLEELGEPRPEVAPAGPLPGEADPLDDSFLKSKPGRYTATITTSRGDVVIELLHREAPRTVQSFVQLAEDGFFDGLIFHRVVPNFVVQGGCPIGNGWGDPGYALRCEYNPLMYERGMVGMAHAGKDTGGSQFFITHSAQPHLDGRYTIFGRVTEGMEVVDTLLVEDVIESVKIKKKLW